MYSSQFPFDHTQFPLSPSGTPHRRQRQFEIPLHVRQNRPCEARSLSHCLSEHHGDITQTAPVGLTRPHLFGQERLRPTMRIQNLGTA
jgi:hypothetical protein